MTIQNKNTIISQKPPLWKKLWDWLIIFDQRMNYDPQQHTYSKLDNLGKEIQVLTSRLEKVELESKSGIK